MTKWGEMTSVDVKIIYGGGNFIMWGGKKVYLCKLL